MSFNLPYLPRTTIVPMPEDVSTFIQYLNRIYEDIAFNVNARDIRSFTIPISTTAFTIPNLPQFGAFIICVSGTESQLPSGVWALCKSDAAVAGVGLTPLTSQNRTGSIWNAKSLTVTSTGTNYQIAHNLSNVTGSFNIRIMGSTI